MAPVLLSYVATLILFVAADAVWLTSTGSTLYRPALGNILLEQIRIAPAIVFYLLYPVGLVVFAVAPALKDGAIWQAAGYGALFGLIAYATYDLTNFATLRAWTWPLAAADLVWGAFASGLAALLAVLATRALAGALGLSH